MLPSSITSFAEGLCQKMLCRLGLDDLADPNAEYVIETYRNGLRYLFRKDVSDPLAVWDPKIRDDDVANKRKSVGWRRCPPKS